MKSCIKCNAYMSDDAIFCSKCGTRQENARDQEERKINLDKSTERAEPRSAQNDTSLSLPIEKIDFSISSMHKASFLGIALIAVSVFMPMVSVIGMMNMALMDYSKLLSLLLLVICGIMGYAVMQRQYVISALAGQSLFLFFLVGYVRYENVLSEVRRGYWGMLAGKALSIEWGVYLFVIGVLLVIFTSLLCGLTNSGKTVNGERLLQQWKDYTLKPTNIRGNTLPGYVWIFVLGTALLFIAFQSNPLRQFQESMNNFNTYRNMFGK